MHSDPILVRLVAVIITALLCGWILDKLKQPAILGYILAGVVLGPQLLGLVPDRGLFTLLGQMGLMFLLFYIGAEIDLKKLLDGWKVSLVGCLLQISLNLVFCFLIGLFAHWPLQQMVFIAFVASLSSTAVVLKILEDNGSLNSPIGKSCLGILLVQDLAVIPMMVILGLFGQESARGMSFTGQILGMAAVAILLYFILTKRAPKIPQGLMGQNQDFKVLAGLLFMLGSAVLMGVLGLSAELGAFVAGVILGSSEEGHSIKDFLNPFKVFFVCLFFVSLGLLFDLEFFVENLGVILLLTVFVLGLNSVINAGTLMVLGVERSTAYLVGTLLSQVGEFSFLLAASALSAGIIGQYGYQMTISVMVLSLMFTPLWLRLARRVLKYSTGSGGTLTFQTFTAASSEQTLRGESTKV